MTEGLSLGVHITEVGFHLLRMVCCIHFVAISFSWVVPFHTISLPSYHLGRMEVEGAGRTELGCSAGHQHLPRIERRGCRCGNGPFPQRPTSSSANLLPSSGQQSESEEGQPRSKDATSQRVRKSGCPCGFVCKVQQGLLRIQKQRHFFQEA